VAIYTFVLFGSASIGVYSLATEKLVIIPPQIPRHKAERVGKWLKTRLVQTMIGESVVVGALACANSNGILLPHFTREEEIEAIKEACGEDFNITIMETRRTAYGNMVLTNDKGAVVDPRLKSREIKQISETLDVEAVPAEIAGLPYVGSLATATNNGVLSTRRRRHDKLRRPLRRNRTNRQHPRRSSRIPNNRSRNVHNTQRPIPITVPLSFPAILAI